MAIVKVYHNPRFLDYQDNHNRVVPPTAPIATVRVPGALTIEEALSWAYARTQHIDNAWWNNEDVLLHVRSTSVGDLLEDENGNHHVVERIGFQPWRPIVVNNVRRLAEVYRLLDAAVNQVDEGHTAHPVRQARDLVLHVLELEGCAGGDVPIMPLRQAEQSSAAQGRLWAQAKPGDIVGDELGRFQVIVRKLRPKWRAKRIQERIPDAQIWIDSPRSWAVLLPVDMEVQP
jgi:hypothetical protein